jgi:hypothetical protein
VVKGITFREAVEFLQGLDREPRGAGQC